MKTIPGVVVVAVALAACSSGSGREFGRYYDPLGLFTTNLPVAHDVTVAPPQAGGDGPELLTGVIARPPQPSPAAPATTTAFNIAPAEAPDQTIYQALAFTTSGFDDLDQMALYFLTGDPSIDVVQDDPVRIDGSEGRLLVADVLQDGQEVASLAAALTLGEQGTGFVVAAVFPPGRWDAERSDFLGVLASFRAGVPPGLEAFPVSGNAP